MLLECDILDVYYLEQCTFIVKYNNSVMIYDKYRIQRKAFWDKSEIRQLIVLWKLKNIMLCIGRVQYFIKK